MSKAAEKLLERMRSSQSGWSLDDLLKLYKGFGFNLRHGNKHDILSHPDFPSLRATVPRHTKVYKIYVLEAVKLIDRFLRLQRERDDE